MKRTEKILWPALSFLMPFLIYLVLFALMGIYPFGDRSLLIIDMEGQYVDYYAWFRHVIQERESLLYSWNGGLGMNMLGLIAYYLMSPFLLLFLIPGFDMIQTVHLITLLKAGCLGLGFYCYARSDFAVPDWLAAALSVCWAMCSYNVVYASNSMWLDVVILLPVLLLGIRRMVERNDVMLLFFCFLGIFLLNYYIAFMAALFAGLYLLAVCVEKKKPITGPVLRFAVTGALAGGCAAVLLLPTALALKAGQSVQPKSPDSLLNFRPLLLPGKLLNGSYDTVTNRGLPNLYTGVLGFAGAVGFAVSNHIPRKEKAAYGGLAAFLMLSFLLRPLDEAWHGFRPPTWFPFRYSFTVSFLLLHMTCRAYEAGVLKQLQFIAPRIGASVALLLLWAAVFGRYEKTLLLRTLILFLGITLILPMRSKKTGAILCLCIVFLDMGLNGWQLMKGLDRQFGYAGREEYLRFSGQYEGISDLTARQGEFYRIENLDKRSANDPLTLNFPGISHYSTTSNQTVHLTLRKWGYDLGTANELRFNMASPVVNSFLGIRKILPGRLAGSGCPVSGIYEDGYVYENTCAFPLLFSGSREAQSLDMDGVNGFELQNQLMSAIIGEKVICFYPLKSVSRSRNLRQNRQGQPYLQYRRVRERELGYLEFQVRNEALLEIYGWIRSIPGFYPKAEAYVNGKSVGNCLAYRNNGILYLGEQEESSLEIRLDSSRLMTCPPLFYGFDRQQLERAAKKVQGQGMSLSEVRQGIIKGTVQVGENEILLSTIAYDPGWNLYVDGQPARAGTYASAFLMAELPPGEHQVELYFLPQGLSMGLFISLVSSLLAALWLDLHKSAKK